MVFLSPSHINSVTLKTSFYHSKIFENVLKEHVQYFEQNKGRKSDVDCDDRPENALPRAIQSLPLFRRHRINLRDICR